MGYVSLCHALLPRRATPPCSFHLHNATLPFSPSVYMVPHAHSRNLEPQNPILLLHSESHMPSHGLALVLRMECGNIDRSKVPVTHGIGSMDPLNERTYPAAQMVLHLTLASSAEHRVTHLCSSTLSSSASSSSPTAPSCDLSKSSHMQFLLVARKVLRILLTTRKRGVEHQALEDVLYYEGESRST